MSSGELKPTSTGSNSDERSQNKNDDRNFRNRFLSRRHLTNSISSQVDSSSTACLPEGEGSESNRKRENPYQSSSIQVVALEFRRHFSNFVDNDESESKINTAGVFRDRPSGRNYGNPPYRLSFSSKLQIKAASIDARFVFAESILRFPV